MGVLVVAQAAVSEPVPVWGQSWPQFGDGAADMSLWEGGTWWPRGQGLALTCYLCSPQAQESCQTVLCGGVGVPDLILVSPPLCPGSEGG